MNHITIDLETLATTVDAKILSIGACVFHSTTGNTGRLFSRNVVLESQGGRATSLTTQNWWSVQSNEAKLALGVNRVPLMAALIKFTYWLESLGGDNILYGNGAAFDNALLRSAYEYTGQDYPISYRNDMCYRTLMALPGKVYDKKSLKEGLIPHVALDDAIWEGRILVAKFGLELFDHISSELAS
jgi:hypothetical protein